jgi:hypothetical protein
MPERQGNRADSFVSERGSLERGRFRRKGLPGFEPLYAEGTFV